MKNLEKLQKIFENVYGCRVHEEDIDTFSVELCLQGCQYEHYAIAYFTEKSVDVEYLVPNLQLEFDFNEWLACEESSFFQFMVEELLESNPYGISEYDVKLMLLNWEDELKCIYKSWYEFVEVVEDVSEKVLDSEENYDLAGYLKWECEEAFPTFVNICAESLDVCTNDIYKCIDDILDGDEYIRYGTIKDDKFFVPTTKGRLLMLNELF